MISLIFTDLILKTNTFILGIDLLKTATEFKNLKEKVKVIVSLLECCITKSQPIRSSKRVVG